MSKKIYKMLKIEEVHGNIDLDLFVFCNNGSSRANVFFNLLGVKMSAANTIAYSIEGNVLAGIVSGVSTTLHQIDLGVDYLETKISQTTALIDSIVKNKDQCSIGIDISVMPKQLFFVIIAYLKKVYDNIEVIVFYTEPKNYVFYNDMLKYFGEGTEHIFSNYKYLDGNLEKKTIPGFAGRPSRANKKLLVIILGFEKGLSYELVTKQSFDKVILINGFPSLLPKFKDISIINNADILHNISWKNILNASANNPFDTYNLLEKIRTENLDCSITIAPLGTKPMALGACLFGLSNEQVSIIYFDAKKFRHSDSIEHSSSWVYYFN